nr:hypothetical protein [Lysinibacillus timonensis]
MDRNLFELKISLKELIQNLVSRIDSVCETLGEKEVERLQFWLEDLSMLTEATLILSESKIIEFDMEIFNEKIELLLDKVEEKDYLFIVDILKFEIKPLLTYWDGGLTND